MTEIEFRRRYPTAREEDLVSIRWVDGREYPAIQGIEVPTVPDDRLYRLHVGIARPADAGPLLTVRIEWDGPEPDVGFSLSPVALSWLKRVNDLLIVGPSRERTPWFPIEVPEDWPQAVSLFRAQA